MNSSKVQQIINQLIEEQQNCQVTRKQYPVAKHQLVKLEELGIRDLMPAKFGYTDAAVVIEAATTDKSAVMNAFGEGEETAASELFAALHEVETVEVTVTNDSRIEIEGVECKIYRNALWIDGGDNDDFLFAGVDFKDIDEPTVIKLSANQVNELKSIKAQMV